MCYWISNTSHHILFNVDCKDLLLDVDEYPEHILVHLQPLQQSCFTGKHGNKEVVTFHG